MLVVRVTHLLTAGDLESSRLRAGHATDQVVKAKEEKHREANHVTVSANVLLVGLPLHVGSEGTTLDLVLVRELGCVGPEECRGYNLFGENRQRTVARQGRRPASP